MKKSKLSFNIDKLHLIMFLSVTLLSIFTCSNLTYAQLFDKLDYELGEEHFKESVKIPPFGPNGIVRALVVFCKFSDDTFDLSPFTDLWPSSQNTLPSWTSSIIAPALWLNYPHPSISGYFRDMSGGRFDVIGDVYPELYIPEHEQSHYWIDNGRHLGYLVEEILTNIDPWVCFDDYDNWDPNDYNCNGIKNEPDGVVDMIMICFRFANTLELDWKLKDINAISGYQGISGLTGTRERFGNGLTTLTLDNVTISASVLTSGTFQNGVTDLHGGLPVLVHEIGHYLFGPTHYKFGNFSLMDGNTAGPMHAFERIKLGWAVIDSIISNQSNVPISDGITSGKVIKVPVVTPGYSFYKDHFLIENRKPISYYLSSWLKYNDGPLRNPGNGLLISRSTRITGGPSHIECADGKWNWEKTWHTWFDCLLPDGTTTTDSGWIYNFPFNKISMNGIFGENEMNLRDKKSSYFSCNITANHNDYLGDEHDFFNIGLNRVFSPWSNPITRRNSQSILDTNNICIEIIKDTLNIFYVNFYTSNPELAAPSKPQNLIISCSVDNNPILKWYRNSEPDITNYKIYKRNSSESGFQYYATTTDTFFIDVAERCVTGPPIPNERNIYYKVTANDNQSKESVPSDSVSTRVRGLPIEKSVSENNLIENYLGQNHPNPFNSKTKISFSVNEITKIKLKIFDILGREVITLMDEVKQKGSYEIIWDATNNPSGIYFYQITSRKYTEAKKMILLR